MESFVNGTGNRTNPLKRACGSAAGLSRQPAVKEATKRQDQSRSHRASGRRNLGTRLPLRHPRV